MDMSFPISPKVLKDIAQTAINRKLSYVAIKLLAKGYYSGEYIVIGKHEGMQCDCYFWHSGGELDVLLSSGMETDRKYYEEGDSIRNSPDKFKHIKPILDRIELEANDMPTMPFMTVENLDRFEKILKESLKCTKGKIEDTAVFCTNEANIKNLSFAKWLGWNRDWSVPTANEICFMENKKVLLLIEGIRRLRKVITNGLSDIAVADPIEWDKTKSGEQILLDGEIANILISGMLCLEFNAEFMPGMNKLNKFIKDFNDFETVKIPRINFRKVQSAGLVFYNKKDGRELSDLPLGGSMSKLNSLKARRGLESADIKGETVIEPGVEGLKPLRIEWLIGKHGSLLGRLAGIDEVDFKAFGADEDIIKASKMLFERGKEGMFSSIQFKPGEYFRGGMADTVIPVRNLLLLMSYTGNPFDQEKLAGEKVDEIVLLKVSGDVFAAINAEKERIMKMPLLDAVDKKKAEVAPVINKRDNFAKESDVKDFFDKLKDVSKAISDVNLFENSIDFELIAQKFGYDFYLSFSRWGGEFTILYIPSAAAAEKKEDFKEDSKESQRGIRRCSSRLLPRFCNYKKYLRGTEPDSSIMLNFEEFTSAVMGKINEIVSKKKLEIESAANALREDYPEVVFEVGLLR